AKDDHPATDVGIADQVPGVDPARLSRGAFGAMVADLACGHTHHAGLGKAYAARAGFSPPVAMSELDAIYAAARAVSTPSMLEQADVTVRCVAPGVRVVALRTPTLPPATHTGCYLLAE